MVDFGKRLKIDDSAARIRELETELAGAECGLTGMTLARDGLRELLDDAQATIERVRGASREILKEQKGPCGRLSDPAWSAYESALEYIAAALDPTTEGSE